MIDKNLIKNDSFLLFLNFLFSIFLADCLVNLINTLNELIKINLVVTIFINLSNDLF
jgi:hypothetical protein